MREEFGKIIGSIAITMAFNIILRLIVIPSSRSLEELRSEFNSQYNNKDVYSVNR
jgi:hypothetical protein